MSGKAKRVKISKDGKTLEFESLTAASVYIGCSKMLLSMVLSNDWKNTHARGWEIEEIEDGDCYTWK